MQIAAVVILYHPDDATLSNIKTYYNFVEKLYIYNNTEIPTEWQHKLQTLSKVEYYQDFKNEGIAKRLNRAAEAAIKDGFKWLLTMDQDTHFSQEAFTQYIHCLEKQENINNIAASGTKFGRKPETVQPNCLPEEVETLITSGMLLNLLLFKKIGGFDEALFIDYVDHDYCTRCIMAGHSVLLFNNISIFHELGKQVYRASVKTLFLYKKKKIIHSPLRCYYMYRNMLYIEKKYEKTNKKFAKVTRRNTIGRINVCLLYGREARKIWKYIKLAKADFRENKMGAIGKIL
ncbi:MAG TPA: hypothetical protein VF610_04480 [Segetibacter sp.]